MADESTKQRLLRAAWELLIESLSKETDDLKLLEQVRATDVARRANLTTGAFYARWPDRETFLADMLDFSLQEERQTSFNSTFEKAQEELDKKPTLRQLIEVGATEDFTNFVKDKAFIVQVHLWSVCQARPEIRERLKKLYGTFAYQWAHFYGIVLEHWGLEPRPPFSCELADTIFSALVEGLTMQSIVGRTVPDELFAQTILALIPAITRPVGDKRELDDLWSDYEREGRLEPSSVPEVQLVVNALQTEREKLQAALDEMDRLEGALVQRLERKVEPPEMGPDQER